MQEGLSQSEAPPSLDVESTVICYRDPYKLRCISTSGSVLEFLLKQILQAGAVGSTDQLLGHLGAQGRRLPLGLVAACCSKCAFVSFHS